MLTVLVRVGDPQPVAGQAQWAARQRVLTRLHSQSHVLCAACAIRFRVVLLEVTAYQGVTRCLLLNQLVSLIAYSSTAYAGVIVLLLQQLIILAQWS